MLGNLNIYREVEAWKKPLHASRTTLAKSYLKLLPNIEVIGITGSVGKTLTQNAIYSVLSQKFRTSVGEENLDPTYRIPQTILSTKPWHQKLILEYGVEQPGDMDHYLAIIKPKIGVITTIAPTHTKYFKDVEGVYKEKSKLVKSLPKNGYAVLNWADPYCQKMAQKTKAQIFWYGENAKDSVKISHFSQTTKGSRFRLHWGGEQAHITTKVVGRHQLISFYAAATVGIINGLTLKQIGKGLSQTLPPSHRLNAVITKKISIIDDTYNSSPKAALESVNTLVDLGKNRQKVAILGEMKDLGEISEESHQALGQKIAKTKINLLVTVGSVAKQIGISAKKRGFLGKIIAAKGVREAANEVKKILKNKHLVLVKGSRHAHLERIVLSLSHKSTEIKCYHCGALR